jgi:hypothetical protein
MRRPTHPFTLAAVVLLGCASAAPEPVVPRASWLRFQDSLVSTQPSPSPATPSDPGRGELGRGEFRYEVVSAVGAVEFTTVRW